MAKAKTISLLLNDGTLKGVISLEDSNWNKGELYSAPRESIDDLIQTDICSKYGVYLLLSEDMVYVGQASDLSKRIKQHLIGKSWWERVVVLTTSDDSFGRSDIDYLEASLISKASHINKLDCDNKNMGNKQKVSRFREVDLEQYLDEALFLLELIGITVFCETDSSKRKNKKQELISTVAKSTDTQIEIREKKEAIAFLKSNNIDVGINVNYSKRQDSKPVFWINPKTHVVENDWDLILNNQFENEIIVIHIPANTFMMSSPKVSGLVSRHDKPDRIDLSIEYDTLIDQRSKCNFANCKIDRIKY